MATDVTIRPRVRFDLYSHHVKVTGFDRAGESAIAHICHDLVTYKQRREGNRVVMEMEKVYAGRTKNRQEYRFHRNQLNDLYRAFEGAGISQSQIETVEHTLYEPVSVEFKVKDVRAPREEQIPVLSYLKDPPKEGFAPSKLVVLQTGKGKAQPLDALVRVPGGWKTMGDMRVGQTVVAYDGSYSTVTGVYPQGKQEIFKVTFADGRQVECCGEHLWRVYRPNRAWKSKVVDTREMIRLKKLSNNRLYIDLIHPEDHADAVLPMDPYTLGALLGDGHLGAGSVLLSTGDSFIVGQIRDQLPQGLSIYPIAGYDYRIGTQHVRRERNTYLDILRHLKLADTRSHTKFIPASYLEGSLQQRWALLQGLMDTDGTVQKSGSISFSSVSEQLANDVAYLVRSLGGIATVRKRQTSYTYQEVRKSGRVCFDVDIRHARPENFFRLERKAERARTNRQYRETLKLSVTSIESIGHKQAQCIAINHPEHLYVTNGFTVTHNTFIALKTLAALGKRAVIVLKAMYIEKWIKDIESPMNSKGEQGMFDFRKGDLMVVRGTKDLVKLISLARAGELEAKIVIISIDTMRMYMQSYDVYNGDMEEFGATPDELFEVLGAGVRLVDEAHQDFHCVYRMDLYFHVPLTISLSATLVNDDRFMNRMYEVVWPMSTRSPKIAHHKYIVVKNLWYSFNEPKRIRYKNYMRQYNHVILEQSIMKDKTMLSNYIAMIIDIVRITYMDDAEPGQKALVFCATKEMCTIVRDALREAYPDKTIGRYIDVDPMSVLEASDLTVTTLKSAGTAVDVINLTRVLCTINVSSKIANEQAVGRLRPVRDWKDVTPEFYFTSARNIDKHCSYAAEKSQKLDGKVLGYYDYDTRYRI